MTTTTPYCGGGGLNGGINALTSDIHEAETRGSALNLLGVFFGIGAVTIPFLIGSLLSLMGLSSILRLAVVVSLVPLLLFARLRFPGARQPHGFPRRDAGQIARDPLLWLRGSVLSLQSGNEFAVGGWPSTYLAALAGMAFGVVIAVGLAGGMVSPRLVGQVAQTAGLRQGLLVPVLNCAMIVVVQLCIMRVLRRRTSG